ncbi:hypothetical protein LY76DRAFT_79756 [Colletotrichum caudatum]|nr:hypothetical protein LY76DRAFT_79756 [Colletotrichum caudatum]
MIWPSGQAPLDDAGRQADRQTDRPCRNTAMGRPSSVATQSIHSLPHDKRCPSCDAAEVRPQTENTYGYTTVELSSPADTQHMNPSIPLNTASSTRLRCQDPFLSVCRLCNHCPTLSEPVREPTSTRIARSTLDTRRHALFVLKLHTTNYLHGDPLVVALLQA